jgi:outer membrane protein insertion porin family
MQLKPRTIFSQTQAQQDLQRVFRLGLFDDVKLSLSPGQDPRKAIVVVNVAERKNFAISPNVGYGSTSGLYAGGNFQANNLGGNNQKLSGEVQWSQRGLQFDANFTDPWIGGDPNRTAYTVNGFKRESIPLVFDGGTTEVTLPNGDRPRVDRTGGGVTFSRPLSETPLGKPEWSATAGLQYQRVAIRDGDGDLSPQDERGNPLSFSGSGKDDLLTASLGVVQDRRNDPLRPTQGSLLRLSTEQSVPIGEGNILFNRLRGSYSLFLPTSLTKFTSGCRQQTPTAAECPQAFAFNVQAGTVIGDLPPYEAFSLGGSNSVRGYGEGDVGSARSFAQISAEYRFPIVSIVNGALFVDAATDFGSGSSVPGDPAGERGKPGIGLGYGLGLRVQSPIGPVRVDFGLNDQGDSRFQFGIGERF